MKKPPKYRRKKVGSRIYAAVRINGKDQMLGKYDTEESKTKYDRVVGEWMQGGSGQANPQQIKVTEVCVDFTLEMKNRYVDRNGNPSNEFGIIQFVMRRLREVYGDTDARSFKAISFKSIRQRFIDDGNKSRKVINKYCRQIIRAFKLATENEKLPPENYQSMEAVETLKKGATTARETKKIPPVPEETIELTLPHPPAIVADIVRVQLLTGMRPDETCQLKPSQINQEGDVWTFEPDYHKTDYRDQSRTIHIGPKAQKILQPYLLRERTNYCFDPRETVEQVRRRRNLERKTPANQGNGKGSKPTKRRPKRTAGERYTTASYRKAIHRACDAASIPRWNPNQIRKTAADKIRKETGSLDAAQGVLGHKSHSTTENFYAYLDDSLAAGTMRQMG